MFRPCRILTPFMHYPPDSSLLPAPSPSSLLTKHGVLVTYLLLGVSPCSYLTPMEWKEATQQLKMPQRICALLLLWNTIRTFVSTCICYRLVSSLTQCSLYECQMVLSLSEKLVLFSKDLPKTIHLFQTRVQSLLVLNCPVSSSALGLNPY